MTSSLRFNKWAGIYIASQSPQNNDELIETLVHCKKAFLYDMTLAMVIGASRRGNLTLLEGLCDHGFDAVPNLVLKQLSSFEDYNRSIVKRMIERGADNWYVLPSEEKEMIHLIYQKCPHTRTWIREKGVIGDILSADWIKSLDSLTFMPRDLVRVLRVSHF